MGYLAFFSLLLAILAYGEVHSLKTRVAALEAARGGPSQ